MLRIALDNVSMRNRIIDCSAYYRVKDYKEHMLNHRHLVQMHSEYPLILEKKSEKPTSSYITKNTTQHQANATTSNNVKDVTIAEAKPKQFRVTKGRDSNRNNATSEGFYKESEARGALEPVQASNAFPKNNTSSKKLIPLEAIPNKTANAVLMTRHFLHEDVILIFEDVVELQREMYHCSLTKPQ